MKKGLLLLLAAVLLPIRVLGAEPDPAPETSAEAMILLHPASGTVLAEKNAEAKHLIASTTKLMTALLAARTLPLEDEVEIRRSWTEVEGSRMYLQCGERYTVRELLEGLLLASGNDAALALAETAVGDVHRFAERMNREAAALGMTGTVFENPHGLDGKAHYSCASDLAKLMAEVVKCAPLRSILGERSCTIHGVVLENHNKLLRSCRGVFAGKTGYTKAAGRCLVTACERDGMELVCVTLSDPNDWKDHAALYDWAYSHYQTFSLAVGEQAGEVPLLSGHENTVSVSVDRDLSLCVPAGVTIRTECALPPFVFAPVCMGETAGTLSVYADDRLLACRRLVWAQSADSTAASSILRDLADRLMGVYRI